MKPIRTEPCTMEDMFGILQDSEETLPIKIKWSVEAK